MDLEDLPRPKPTLTIGEPLDAISLEELKARIAALEEEIGRIRSEISKKQASKAAADAFFKS
ncbi:MAG: DUF1192 domain-containing protein [Proteobacteria bacterium]|nr:DUF1192 domain-containing protein [Pseudomonadota bacterium]